MDDGEDDETEHEPDQVQQGKICLPGVQTHGRGKADRQAGQEEADGNKAKTDSLQPEIRLFKNGKEVFHWITDTVLLIDSTSASSRDYIWQGW